MPKYLVIPAADGDGLTRATIHGSATLSGLSNGTAYVAYRLSEASAAFTPQAEGGTGTGLAPMPELLTRSAVLVVGDSLFQQGFDADANGAFDSGLAAYMTALGFTATRTKSYAVSGATAEAVAAQAAAAAAEYPGPDKLILAVGGGNDMGGRPYPGGAAAFAASYAVLMGALRDAGGLVAPFALHKRYFVAAPAVTADPATEGNGALPYNLNIIEPLIAGHFPAMAQGGRALLSGYPFTDGSQWMLSTGDGVHMATAHRQLFARQALAQVAGRALGLRRGDSLAGRAFLFGVAGFGGSAPAVVPGNPTRLFSDQGQTCAYVGARDTAGRLNPDIVIRTTLSNSPLNSQGKASGMAGAAAFSRIADARMHDATLLGEAVYTATTATAPYQVIFDKLPPGDRVTVKCAAGHPSAARTAALGLNGAEVLTLRAGPAEASNMIAFAPVTVPASGQITLSMTQAEGVTGILSAVLLDFA